MVLGAIGIVGGSEGVTEDMGQPAAQPMSMRLVENSTGTRRCYTFLFAMRHDRGDEHHKAPHDCCRGVSIECVLFCALHFYFDVMNDALQNRIRILKI